MFFEAAHKGQNNFWRYLVMFVAVFAATNTIGALPLIVVMFTKTAQSPEILDNSTDKLMDLSVYGIGSNLGLILMMIPFIIGIIVLLLLMKPLHGRSFLSVFNGGKNIRWSRFFYSAFLWMILMGIYLYIDMARNPGNFTLNNASPTIVWLVIIAVCLIPFQTSFEEIFFRGYLMQGSGSWFGNKWGPLILTSLLFGLMHALNPEIKEFGFFVMMPQYVTFGLVFGLLVVFDDGIELAMGAHAANNLFLSVFLTQESSALQTSAIYEQKEIYPWTEFFFLIVISLIFIILLRFTYKWNLKEVFSINKKN